MRFSLLKESFHDESVVRAIFANYEGINGAQGTSIMDFIEVNFIRESYCITRDGYIKLISSLPWMEISKHGSHFSDYTFFFIAADEFLTEYMNVQNKQLMKMRILSKNKAAITLPLIESLDIFISHSKLSFAIQNYWDKYGLSFIFFERKELDITKFLQDRFEEIGLIYVPSDDWYKMENCL